MGSVYRAATTSSLLGSTSMSPATSPSCWMCMDMDTSAGRAGSARMSGLEAGPWGVDSTGRGAGAVHLHGLALVQISNTPLPKDPTPTAVSLAPFLALQHIMALPFVAQKNTLSCTTKLPGTQHQLVHSYWSPNISWVPYAPFLLHPHLAQLPGTPTPPGTNFFSLYLTKIDLI